jgi:hypothetical protein
MPQTVIENPIINSPFTEPDQHFRFTDEGITNEIVAGRRISSYSSRSPGRRNKASNSFSIPNGQRIASRRTDSPIGSASG